MPAPILLCGGLGVEASGRWRGCGEGGGSQTPDQGPGLDRRLDIRPWQGRRPSRSQQAGRGWSPWQTLGLFAGASLLMKVGLRVEGMSIGRGNLGVLRQIVGEEARDTSGEDLLENRPL